MNAVYPHPLLGTYDISVLHTNLHIPPFWVGIWPNTQDYEIATGRKREPSHLMQVYTELTLARTEICPDTVIPFFD